MKLSMLPFNDGNHVDCSSLSSSHDPVAPMDRDVASSVVSTAPDGPVLRPRHLQALAPPCDPDSLAPRSWPQHRPAPLAVAARPRVPCDRTRSRPRARPCARACSPATRPATRPDNLLGGHDAVVRRGGPGGLAARRVERGAGAPPRHVARSGGAWLLLTRLDPVTVRTAELLVVLVASRHRQRGRARSCPTARPPSSSPSPDLPLCSSSAARCRCRLP